MSLAEALRMSLLAIRVNALRSFLTALGVIIGVATFIATLAIGIGSQRAVAQRVESLGTNLVTAFPAFGGGAQFTVPLLAQLEQETPDIARAMPVFTGQANVAYGATVTQASLQGVSQAWPAMHGVGMAGGSFFSAGDVGRRALVAVLGQTVVQSCSPSARAPSAPTRTTSCSSPTPRPSRCWPRRIRRSSSSRSRRPRTPTWWSARCR
jgi:putative ABC transport system permease protein